MAILQVQYRCPHCRELKDFVLTQASEIVRREIPDGRPPIWESQSVHRIGGRPGERLRATEGSEFCGLARCPHCHNPTMFVILAATSQLRQMNGSDAYNTHQRVVDSFRVLATYPQVESLAPHPTWPAEIASIFNETRQFLREGRSNFFVLAGCRSTLDVVTQKMGAADGNLKQRIDKLAADGKITTVLKEWAHKLRLDGNEALHEGDNGRVLSEDPTQYVAFLELLLHMGFELANEIKERQPPEDRA